MVDARQRHQTGTKLEPMGASSPKREARALCAAVLRKDRNLAAVWKADYTPNVCLPNEDSINAT